MSDSRTGLRFAVDSHHSVISNPQQRGTREDLRRAVDTFLKRETRQVDAYMDYLDEHVPYRREPQTPPR